MRQASLLILYNNVVAAYKEGEIGGRGQLMAAEDPNPLVFFKYIFSSFINFIVIINELDIEQVKALVH